MSESLPVSTMNEVPISARSHRAQRRGTRRRRQSVFFEIVYLIVLYLIAFESLIGPMRRFETDSIARFFSLTGSNGVSVARNDSLLIVSGRHQPILAYLSPSCSSLMGLLALAVLAAAVMRQHRGKTLAAYLLTAVVLFVLNLGRMIASTAAGLLFGHSALLLFHDWVGTVWNFMATLFGFLLLQFLTMPASDRAEQDRFGRHTARRPETWSRPGLGYRSGRQNQVRAHKIAPWRWIVSHVLPASLRDVMGKRRETNRIDYRLGFLDLEQRRHAIVELSERGLELHGASLLAIATYEIEPSVLDVLAHAIKAQRTQIVTSPRAAMLQLWARAWMQGLEQQEVITLDPSTIQILTKGSSHRRGGKTAIATLLDTNANDASRRDLLEKLCDEGLAFHCRTLIAFTAAIEESGLMDDAAAFIATRQWEPVSSSGVAGLRLWARGWTLARESLIDDVELASIAVGSSPPAVTVHSSNEKFPNGIGRGGPFIVGVTGAGGPAGVSVVRALKKAGHHVVAFDADPHAGGFKIKKVDWCVVPRFDDAVYAPTMLELTALHSVQALICTVAEEYAALTPISQALIDNGCKNWLPDPSAVELCVDKAKFAYLMDDHNIAHPATTTRARGLRRVPGPWIVKPRRGRGSRGITSASSLREVRSLMRHHDNLIAQTQLVGDEFTADVLVDRNGQMMTCVPRWRLATRGGISVHGLTFDSSEVTRVCAEVIAATGITGPANIQGMVDDGFVTIIELNPRFSGGLPLTLAAGADVVGAYLQAILEPQRRIAPLYFEPGVRMTRIFKETIELSS